MWHFPSGDLDSRSLKDPTEYTVQSHGRLTELQIFVREVLQNALDNRCDSGQVLVRFGLRYLWRADKRAFLDAIDFHTVEPHLRAVRDYELATFGSSLARDVPQLLSEDEPLKLLVIEDYGTRGLVGPEHEMEKARLGTDEPSCFIGLCRNIGDSQKGAMTLGGTYGFGKTVLWKYSRLKTVMFYSRLATPYIRSDTTSSHDRRAFGQVRLRGHAIDECPFRGEGYFGERGDEPLTRALYDWDADRLAASIGIDNRSVGETGTAIVVVDFDDPDVPDDEETENDTAAGIVRAAERYFWPAIEDGRLSVSASGSDHRDSELVAAPAENHELSAHIAAYRAIKGQELPETSVAVFEAEVPKGPGTEEAGRGNVSVGIQIGENLDSPAELRSRAALVRGAGMVVGYWRVPRRGLSGKEYSAVVLGGQAVSGEQVGQRRLEKLLAWAEPVTHDNWTDNSDMLRQWRGSKAAIRKIRDAVARIVSEKTMQSESPEGRAAPLLARMFPLGRTDQGPTHREIGVAVTKPPHQLRAVGDRVVYGFEVRLSIPSRDRFGDSPKPVRWRASFRYGFLGEARARKIVESCATCITGLRTDGSDWLTIDGEPEFGASYDGPIEAHQQTVFLRGETAPLDPTLAGTGKHDLRIAVDSGHEEVSE